MAVAEQIIMNFPLFRVAVATAKAISTFWAAQASGGVLPRAIVAEPTAAIWITINPQYLVATSISYSVSLSVVLGIRLFDYFREADDFLRMWVFRIF